MPYIYGVHVQVHRYSDKRDNFLKNAFVDFVTLCDLDVFFRELFSECMCKKFSMESLVCSVLNITFHALGSLEN